MKDLFSIFDMGFRVARMFFNMDGEPHDPLDDNDEAKAWQTGWDAYDPYDDDDD